MSENGGPSTSSTSSPLLTNPVREPAVQECLIGWPALSEAQIALTLERLERAEQDGLTAARPPNRQERVQRAERGRADAAVRCQVGIIPAVTVEFRLKGLPTASTHSPTFILSEFP